MIALDQYCGGERSAPISRPFHDRLAAIVERQRSSFIVAGRIADLERRADRRGRETKLDANLAVLQRREWAVAQIVPRSRTAEA